MRRLIKGIDQFFASRLKEKQKYKNFIVIFIRQRIKLKVFLDIYPRYFIKELK